MSMLIPLLGTFICAVVIEWYLSHSSYYDI